MKDKKTYCGLPSNAVISTKPSQTVSNVLFLIISYQFITNIDKVEYAG